MPRDTRFTTPLNHRGLKRGLTEVIMNDCFTTPLNHRGLKPQDIVYFAILEGEIPPFTFNGTQKQTKKSPVRLKKAAPGIVFWVGKCYTIIR